MTLRPSFPAEIAKLMSALACHVIAAFIFFQHHPALLTSPEEVVALHVKNSILVAVSAVPGKHAHFAEGNTADRTLDLFF